METSGPVRTSKAKEQKTLLTLKNGRKHNCLSFSVINEAEVDVFLELSFQIYDPTD